MIDEAVSPSNREAVEKYKNDKNVSTILSREKYIPYHQKMMEVVRGKR